MNRFLLHPDAYGDLAEIWEYLASDNIAAADRLRNEFLEAIRDLIAFPRKGHHRPDLTVYAPEMQPLVVMAIIHGRRNPRVLADLLQART